MKTVCISTFCVWNSYGSMLQAYGLQYALKQMDCRGVIASAKPAPMAKWAFPDFQTGSIKGMAVDVHRLLIGSKIRRRYAASNDFIRRNIDITYYGSQEALGENPPKADAYLAGSDQIWNPRRLEPAFFLDFAPEGYPRISYAASMGTARVPAAQEEALRRLVGAFDHISLRERAHLPVMGRYTNRPVDVHIDPVFLVPRDHWQELEQPYPITEPYILVCPIHWDRGLNRQLKRLHQLTGKKVVAVLGQAQRVYANKRIYDASPEQFLWLIDHADAVVSSSFHGLAMSVVFEKPFAAVMDPKTGARLRCLLETLGATNPGIEALAGTCGQDYRAIAEKIQAERERSMAYLRKVLGVQNTAVPLKTADKN